MISVRGYAASAAKAPLGPIQFQRREPGDKDIVIDILFCGICHTDVHQTRDEWGGSKFPMVPGHEIVGRVSRVGRRVRRFKPGAIAGIGCFVDSCRRCARCKAGEQQFCEKQPVWTYNSTDADGQTTQGGYSSQIVVDEDYALKIPPKLPLERVAPLLCAGITTYSPLRHWKVGKGSQVGVVGLGGLGHMGVKIARGLGAEVTVLSRSRAKEDDARRLGARRYIAMSEGSDLAAAKNSFDFILDTVSAPHDIQALLELLRVDGHLVLVGVPPAPLSFQAFGLIEKRRSIGGSLIGGLKETQEMLDFCARKKILADVEVIPVVQINEAYERMVRGDVRYRFVIDLKTL